jgi:hypothetical protein
MAEGDVKSPASNDWILGNPWFWMVVALLLGGVALLLVRADPGQPTFQALDKYSLGVISANELRGTPWQDDFHRIDTNRDGLISRVEFDEYVDADQSVLRFLLVFASLLCVGVSLNLRLRSDAASFLQPAQSRLLALATAGFHCLVAIGVTMLVVLCVLEVEWVPWKLGHLIIFWFVLVPMSATATGVMYQRVQSGGPMTKGEEGSALLTVTALACLVNFWALYRAPAPDEADTMRTLLSGAMLATIVGAPLVAVPRNVRRAVVSGLVLLHFGGIATAGLSAPPSPGIMVQLWTRIYRPYLEFIYMNNAYHFYAPEPGPASYLWFRLTYVDPETSLHYYQWVKIPDIDEDGTPRYPVALAYQRILALTENTVSGSQAAAFFTPEVDAFGQVVTGLDGEVKVKRLPFYQARTDVAKDKKDTRLGKEPPPVTYPFQPYVAEQQQYIEPLLLIKNLLKAYARHVARTPPPPLTDTNPPAKDLRIHRVKIYKVTHDVPWPPHGYLRGRDIREPEFYRSYFMGEFTPDGELVSKGTTIPPKAPDAMLYWMMPTIPIIDLVKIVIPDPNDGARATQLLSSKSRHIILPKNTFLVPDEHLRLLKNGGIRYDVVAKPAPVLKSYLRLHAHDKDCYYLADEKKWVRENEANE